MLHYVHVHVTGDKPVDASLLAAYLAYVKLEQAQGDPARVQVMGGCLGERENNVYLRCTLVMG